MRAVEEIIGERKAGRLRSGPGLTEFCEYLAGKPARQEPEVFLPPEELAAEFRRFFCLPTPVRPCLEALCKRLGIVLTPHGNGADPDAAVAFDEEKQRWELYVRFDAGPRQSLSVFQELYKVIWSECRQRSARWRYEGIATMMQRRASQEFAFAVVLPPETLVSQAMACGLNPWSLATRFMTSPGACAHRLLRHLHLPFPYFQAHLNFRPDTPLQSHLFFAEQGVRAEVWRKGVKRAIGESRDAWPEMEALARRFPRRGQILEAEGLLFESIRSGTSRRTTTDRLAGIVLPGPVSVVMRPNGTAQSQLFVQVVPERYGPILWEEQM